MKMTAILLAAGILISGCNKMATHIIDEATADNHFNQYIAYNIPEGAHYCNENRFSVFEGSKLNFMVKFDSSAIYTSVHQINQKDINKLYGFSDNDSDHHQYSARFGWRWSDGALRLFAYVYNEGRSISKEIGTIGLNEEVSCSISVDGDAYIFTMNEMVLSMPRKATSSSAKGYQLYPYFGGDEPAPHTIRIWIKKLQ